MQDRKAETDRRAIRSANDVSTQRYTVGRERQVGHTSSHDGRITTSHSSNSVRHEGHGRQVSWLRDSFLIDQRDQKTAYQRQYQRLNQRPPIQFGECILWKDPHKQRF
eukprot:3059718-Amphidinium_carterae.1